MESLSLHNLYLPDVFEFDTSFLSNELTLSLAESVPIKKEINA